MCDFVLLEVCGMPFSTHCAFVVLVQTSDTLKSPSSFLIMALQSIQRTRTKPHHCFVPQVCFFVLDRQWGCLGCLVPLLIQCFLPRPNTLSCTGKGHTEVAKLLLDHGAAVDSKNKVELTPLHWAASAFAWRTLLHASDVSVGRLYALSRG